MRTTLLSDAATVADRSVATIGFFDGVHIGHQYLLRRVIDASKECGMASMAITFDRHPRTVTDAGFHPTLLSSLDEKLELIAATGIDHCVILPFTEEMALLSAYDFMDRILKRRLNAGRLFMGYDNRFGHNRSDTFDDYMRYGAELGIDVIRNDALETGGIKVSSSAVRRLISEGDMEKAAECLGRPYCITGIVVGGYKKGRKMGFPTANIEIGDSMRLIPATGVYAVKVKIDKCRDVMPGMLNIGYRPTFGGNRMSIEVNIFDYEGDLYGKLLTVEFYHRIRDERKFDSIEQLVEQLIIDRKEIEKR